MMNEFDEKLVRKCLDQHQAVGLDSKDDDETKLWHILRSVIEFCDAQHPRIDFKLLVENVREDFRNDANKPPVKRKA